MCHSFPYARKKNCSQIFVHVRVNINLVSFAKADVSIMPMPNPSGFEGDPCVAVMASALGLHLFDVRYEFPPFRKAFLNTHSNRGQMLCAQKRAADFPTSKYLKPSIVVIMDSSVLSKNIWSQFHQHFTRCF